MHSQDSRGQLRLRRCLRWWNSRLPSVDGSGRQVLTRVLSLATAATALLPAATGAASPDARIPLSVALASRGYKEIAFKKGVRVYKHKASKIIRLGADGIIAQPPAQVRAALLDYRNQIGVLERLSECRVLSRTKNNLWVYQRLNLPVISDRDFTLAVRWGGKQDSMWITYSAVRGLGPTPRKGVVRVKHHVGSWQLEASEGGRKTRARFQVSIDLAGWLPRWVARSGAGKELPQLFASIEKMAKRRRAQGAKTAKAGPSS